MKEKTTIEPGDNVLIDGVIWAEVEEVAEGLNGEELTTVEEDLLCSPKAYFSLKTFNLTPTTYYEKHHWCSYSS